MIEQTDSPREHMRIIFGKRDEPNQYSKLKSHSLL